MRTWLTLVIAVLALARLDIVLLAFSLPLMGHA